MSVADRFAALLEGINPQKCEIEHTSRHGWHIEIWYGATFAEHIVTAKGDTLNAAMADMLSDEEFAKLTPSPESK